MLAKYLIFVFKTKVLNLWIYILGRTSTAGSAVLRALELDIVLYVQEVFPFLDCDVTRKIGRDNSLAKEITRC